MSEQDDENEPEGLKGWKKAALVVLATAPIGFAVLSFVFMAQSEVAFDEASCPYQEAEVRVVRAGVSVREDERACQDGVEEHRWVLMRDGREPLELGRRRLEAQLYEGYSWTVSEPEGRVRIEILNPGHDPRVFREPSPDSGLAP